MPMAKKILPILFWLIAAALVVYGLLLAGWALVVPGAAVLSALIFAADVKRHRHLVALDRELAHTFLNLVSAAALAAACMYWLVRLFFPTPP